MRMSALRPPPILLKASLLSDTIKVAGAAGARAADSKTPRLAAQKMPLASSRVLSSAMPWLKRRDTLDWLIVRRAAISLWVRPSR